MAYRLNVLGTTDTHNGFIIVTVLVFCLTDNLPLIRINRARGWGYVIYGTIIDVSYNVW